MRYLKHSSTPTTPVETETKSPKSEVIQLPSPREVKPPVEELTPSQIDAMLLFISALTIG